jgi:hypothetical protein
MAGRTSVTVYRPSLLDAHNRKLVISSAAPFAALHKLYGASRTKEVLMPGDGGGN